MKIDQLASQSGAASSEVSVWSYGHGQVSHTQLLMMQKELERAEDENHQLNVRITELTKTLQDHTNENEVNSLRAQLALQQEQLAQLQKVCVPGSDEA